MQELRTNRSLFEIANGLDEAICVTTNGMVKKNYLAVMGAGVAKQCADLFPSTQQLLGMLLLSKGNCVHNLGKHCTTNSDGYTIDYLIFSFPTKHHWKSKSDINLIKKSACEIMIEADTHNLKRIYLPQVGCKNGGLNWETDVYPAIKDILDDRFIVLIRD